MSAATGLARSLQVRLARHARAIDADPNLVLARYGTERFLYRLSRSPYAAAPEDLAATIAELARFALPVMQAASRAQGFAARWAPGGPWR